MSYLLLFLLGIFAISPRHQTQQNTQEVFISAGDVAAGKGFMLVGRLREGKREKAGRDGSREIKKAESREKKGMVSCHT